MKINGKKTELRIDGFFTRLNKIIRDLFIDIEDIYDDTIYINYASPYYLVEILIDIGNLCVETTYAHKKEEVE